MGICKNCHKEFGIPPCLVYGNPNNNMNELKLKNIFSHNLEKLQDDSQELIAELNTKNLDE